VLSESYFLLAKANRFANITSFRDSGFIPGAVKYGDPPGLLNLAASHPVCLLGEDPNLYKAAKVLFKKAAVRFLFLRTKELSTTLLIGC